MNSASHLRSIAVVLLSLVLVACGTANPPTQSLLEPIIPETTKVADPLTRAALADFDTSSGDMRFTTITPVLAALETGDVLVGEGSAAAPHGYLRMVTAIREEGGDMVLETTQANLIDAIHQGELLGEGVLTADDVQSTAVHVQGVTATVLAPSDGVAPLAGIGRDYSFHVGFDEAVLEFGEGATSEIRVQGEISFGAGWGVHVRIQPCWKFPPVCVTRFEAKIGVEETVGLKLSGEANAAIDKEVLVASFHYKPLVFFIGPVPVWVTPTIEVYVGASGEVNMKFEYGFVQTAQAQAGARWTPNGGWEDITGFDFGLETQNHLTIEQTMLARAYVKPAASLRFYNVAGPVLSVSLAAELDAMFPRDPTWIARGVIKGDIGFIVDIPVIGRVAEYEKTVFTHSKELTRSKTEPPVIVITEPGSGASFPLGTEILFEATAQGMTGNPLAITWSFAGTDVVTQPGPLGAHVIFYDALPPGAQTVTAAVVDTASGLQAQAQVSLDVTYDPPEAYIIHPKTNQVLWADEPLLLSGQGVSGPFTMAADQVAWRVVSGATTVHAALGHATMVPGQTLPIGTYQIRLTVHDDVETTERTITITTIAKPPYVPTATITSPLHGDVVASGTSITFTGTGSDVEDGPLSGTRFRWTAESTETGVIVLCEGNAFSGVAVPVTDCSSFTAALDGHYIDDQAIGTVYTVALEVIDSDDNADRDAISVMVVIPPTP